MPKRTTGLFDDYFNPDDDPQPMHSGSGAPSAPDAAGSSSEEPTRPMPSLFSLDFGEGDDGDEPTRPSPIRHWNQPATRVPRHKILVVEDEGIVALDLGMTLQQMGYIVTGAATSGEEAVQLAIATMPDVVLMDVRLRGQMDGIEASREIRRRLGVPVIFLTAFVDEKTMQRAESIMPAGFLRKPFVESELLNAIEAAIKPPAFD